MWGTAHHFPVTVGDGSQRGEGNGAEGGPSVDPVAVYVDGLTDGATRQLVEGPKWPEP